MSLRPGPSPAQRMGMFLFLSAALLPFGHVARATAMQEEMSALVTESDSLTQRRTELEAAQQALLEQQQALATVPGQLTQRQTDLNQRSAVHDKDVEDHKQRLKRSRAECNNDGNADGTNTHEHVNACSLQIKKYNQQTQDIDAQGKALQAEQDDIDKAQVQYMQDTQAWNDREQENTSQLNSIYRATNDWLDRSYTFLSSSAFREEIQWTRQEAYCGHRDLPDGRLNADQLAQLSTGYRGCLKHVQDHERKVTAAAHKP